VCRRAIDANVDVLEITHRDILAATATDLKHELVTQIFLNPHGAFHSVPSGGAVAELLLHC
jgi:hypothetical protein